jgi:hypothetical protein
MSIVGTVMLLVMQFVEFVRREYSAELGSRILSIPRHLFGGVKTLTLTVPVAATYRR